MHSSADKTPIYRLTNCNMQSHNKLSHKYIYDSRSIISTKNIIYLSITYNNISENEFSKKYISDDYKKNNVLKKYIK